MSVFYVFHVVVYLLVRETTRAGERFKPRPKKGRKFSVFGLFSRKQPENGRRGLGEAGVGREDEIRYTLNDLGDYGWYMSRGSFDAEPEHN
ncbi:hypothetical protein GCM10023183_13170 [Nibribacter koreensis]|uniref:Uncharacterized protein n=1 Tax=Nibribacter koreensis TaxID=1084519 RepID=A0ABP8FEF1_9BACT